MSVWEDIRISRTWYRYSQIQSHCTVPVTVSVIRARHTVYINICILHLLPILSRAGQRFIAALSHTGGQARKN